MGFGDSFKRIKNKLTRAQSGVADAESKGDEAQAEETKEAELETGEHKEVNITLYDSLVDALYEMLPGGWEINEGAYGEFIYKDKKIKHTHNRAVEEYETTNETYEGKNESKSST